MAELDEACGGVQVSYSVGAGRVRPLLGILAPRDCKTVYNSSELWIKSLFWIGKLCFIALVELQSSGKLGRGGKNGLKSIFLHLC